MMLRLLFFKKTLSILFVVFLSTSCQLIGRKALGLKKVKYSNGKRITKFANKYKIPTNSTYVIDEKKYWLAIKKLKNTDPDLLNNLLQPTQIKGVNNDSINFALFSCITPTKGLNINWNGLNTFDTFPIEPISTQKTALGSFNWHYNEEVSYLKTLDNKSFNKTLLNDAELILFGYWSIVGGRQSKHMISELEAYKNRFPNHKITIIYVNIDNLYIEIENEK